MCVIPFIAAVKSLTYTHKKGSHIQGMVPIVRGFAAHNNKKGPLLDPSYSNGTGNRWT